MIGWFLGRPGGLLTGTSALQTSDQESGGSDKDHSPQIASLDRRVVADVQPLAGSSASPTASPVISIPPDICERSLQLRKLCSVVLSIKLSSDLCFAHIPQQMLSNLLLYDLRNALSHLRNSRQLTSIVTLDFNIRQAKLTLRGSPELVSSCIDALNLQMRNESSALRKGLLSSTMSLQGVGLSDEGNSINLGSSIGRNDVQAAFLGVFILLLVLIFRRRIFACSMLTLPEAFQSVGLWRAGTPRRDN